jgi:anaphase-promoting complex subunit 3
MRPAPVKQGPPEEPLLAKALSGPTATGIVFFTPDITANTSLFVATRTSLKLSQWIFR